MADPTLTNGQITDSVTQTTLGVQGLAPSSALASQMQSTGHTSSLGVQNALANQQHISTLSLSTTAQSVNQILGLSAAISGRSFNDALTGNPLVQYLAQLISLREMANSSRQMTQGTRRREQRIPGQTVISDSSESMSVSTM